MISKFLLLSLFTVASIGKIYAQSISCGNNHTLYICSDGTVRSWGSNSSGQLGNGTVKNSDVPVEVVGLTGIIAVAGGQAHSLALKNDGTVWTWGNNSSGQLGCGDTLARTQPVLVTGLTDVIAIAAGFIHSLALKSDSTVWTWGDNSSGQLGDSTNISSSTPVQVKNLTGVKAITGGQAHSLALKNDGTVWAWGYNYDGELGDFTFTNRITPIKTKNVGSIIAIATHYGSSFAIKKDSTMWAWGRDSYFNLGNGLNAQGNVPAQCIGLAGVKAVAPGSNHTIALCYDGTIWSVGTDVLGQRMDTGISSTTVYFAQVQGLNNINAIASGDNHSFAMDATGYIYAWGDNWYGQLGTKVRRAGFLPVAVPGLSSITAVAATKGGTYSGTNFHCVAIRNDSTVWSWGDGGYLGNGTNNSSYQPVQVVGLTGIIGVSVGYSLTLAVKSDGTVWIWDLSQSLPAQITSLSGIVAVSSGDDHALALKNDSTVWSWGWNLYGQLGNNTGLGNYNETPLQVKNVHNIVAIAAGDYYSLALQSDGTVWEWGNNFYYQFGDTTIKGYTPIPTKNRFLSGIKAIAAGNGHSCALDQDSTLWVFGDNVEGDLGDGSMTPKSLPYHLTGLPKAVAIDAGNRNTFFVTGNGELWSSGDNSYFQNCDSSVITVPSLARVNNLSDIAAVAGTIEYTVALTKNGSVLTWGDNSEYELGDTSFATFRIQLSDPCSFSVGTHEIEKKSPELMTINPNPSTGIIIISFHKVISHGVVTISIINMLGEMMQEEKLNWSGDASINIKGLAAGIYFLQLKSESGSVVKRFVKE